MDVWLLKLATACAAVAACASSAAQESREPLPIAWEADSFSLDRKTSLLTFVGLRLTQGELALQADHAVATGLDAGSEWQFTGNVRITIDAALIEADSAKFRFGEGALAVAELAGDPALFTDTNPERRETARGGAHLLVYDYAAQTLRLAEGAWLSVGRNEIRGCDLIYDFAEGQVMSGSSACGERFSITIVPPADEPESGADRSP